MKPCTSSLQTMGAGNHCKLLEQNTLIYLLCTHCGKMYLILCSIRLCTICIVVLVSIQVCYKLAIMGAFKQGTLNALVLRSIIQSIKLGCQ